MNNMRWMKWLGIAACLITVVVLPGGKASAHAALLRSDPPHGASLAKSPQRINLVYTEAVDISFISIRLVDSDAKEIPLPPPGIRPETENVLTLFPPDLPDGTYSLIWKVRSAVDGHVTNGVVSFSIGEAAPLVSLLPAPEDAEPALASPPVVDTVIRWASYLMAALAAGGFAFGLFVWRPSTIKAGGKSAEKDGRVTQLVRRMAIIGAGGLIAATAVMLVYQAARASGVGFPDVLGAPLMQIILGRTGALAVLRIILLVGVIVVALKLPTVGEGSARLWWIAVGLNAVAMITFSMQSHAAARDLWLVALVDWVHLLAMSAWVGGLVMLAVVIGLPRVSGYAGQPPLVVLIPRFSRMALSCVAALGVTGLVQALVHVGTFDALINTTYGWALIDKLVLFAALLTIGAINLFVITRKFEAGGDGESWLKRTVPAEILLVAGALVAAGLMTGSPPAQVALEEQARIGYVQSAENNGADVRLIVVPAKVGNNEFGVDVNDPRPGSADVPARVVLRFKSLDVPMGQTEVEAETTDGKRFTVRGAFFSVGGSWQVEVIVRRRAYDDVRHVFEVSLPGNPVAANLPGVDEPDYPNPVAADASSIAVGKALYETNCAACHGALGRGDGPVGLTLNPRPADLTQHAEPGVHTDAQLYEWITGGYPGVPAMPAFEKVLTDEERWSLVNFVRTLWVEPQ